MHDLLERNLAAIGRPDVVARIRSVAVAPPITVEPAKLDDAPTATLTTPDGRQIALASRHRPLQEAARMAQGVDLDEHAVIVCIGLGVGHHVRAIAQRVGDCGMVVVYEPDAGQLRAVLERFDVSDVLGHPNVMLKVGPVDAAELTAELEANAGTVTQGVQFVTHPPTRQLHAAACGTFMDQVTNVVAYCRTQIATTLVHASVTCRNLTANLAPYAAGASINELAMATMGKPAVLVSAGPSLARNVALLAEPGVRDRVVIIAVQTALKPLLDRGVRPHFVTALDYHEISRRFYEDLPPDLGDITMIAEPKANPAILDAWPGPVRVLGNRYLDTLLGPLARPMMSLQAGSTVAHLSLYFAQHLGCDPIVMIGQDLGFSDGLYYCPGTAIHDVWAGELGAFNTLETMELKRILRHKSHLQQRTDIRGQPIRTDEQMLTYLSQFERDFASAAQTIIDATEGGLSKQHTQQMTLTEALGRYAVAPLDPLPAPARSYDPARIEQIGEHVERRRAEVQTFRDLSAATQPVLEKMLKHQRDPAKINPLFDELEQLKSRAAAMDDAFAIVGELNQVGMFKRIRSDRRIKLAGDDDPYLKQARQLERDIENVQWITQACDEAIDMLGTAADRLRTRLASEAPSITTTASDAAEESAGKGAA